MTLTGVIRTTFVRMAPAALAILVGRYLARDDDLAVFVAHPLHLALLAYLVAALFLLAQADRRRRSDENRHGRQQG